MACVSLTVRYDYGMVIDEIKQKVNSILQRAGVKRAAVFGSFARGEATAKSDLDLLIEFQGEKTLFDLIALKRRLEQILGMSVDLITYQSLSPLLRDSIMQEQIPVL